MSTTILKLIAIIAMTCDHYAFALLETDTTEYFLLRLVGRLTAPIMAFMLTEGYKHTRSKKKYFARLISLAIVSQPIYYLFIFGVPENGISMLKKWNIIYSFVVALILLCVKDRKNLNLISKGAIMSVLLLLSMIGDYGLLIPAWVMIFSSKLSKKNKATLFIISTTILLYVQYRRYYENFFQLSYMFGVIIALVPILLYSGKQGRYKLKWVFYCYYPIHTIVLYFISEGYMMRFDVFNIISKYIDK